MYPPPRVASTLDTYLASLPDGLRSLPRAQIKGNVLDEQIGWLDEAGVQMDPRIAVGIRTVRPLGRTMEWVPEVLSNAISLNAREGYRSDEAWIQAVYDRQRRFYATPLYRALMLVMSPTLMTMGAQQRWGAYRKGSELLVAKWHKEGGKNVTFGTLRFPPGLFNLLMLRGFTSTMRAAVDAAGAKDSVVVLLEDELSPGEARYRLSYRG